jgi:hypothetical protein
VRRSLEPAAAVYRPRRTQLDRRRFSVTAIARALVGALASICIVGAARAQQPAPGTDTPAQAALRGANATQNYVVKLRDGSTFMGRVQEVRNDSVFFVSRVGQLTLALADVREATLVREKDMRAGEYWFPNPNTTRLMFAPTGRMLDKGKGYFSDYMVFFPGVAVGVTSQFTIGGGMSLFPGVSPAEQLFYLTPKVGIVASEKVNVAVGALALNVPSSSDGTAGLLYGVSTFGEENGSITLGAGFGFVNGDLSNTPALMFGGDTRVSPRFALVTENYIFPGELDGALVSLGMRFLGEKMAFDLGFVMPVGASEVFALPFVGFVSNF